MIINQLKSVGFKFNSVHLRIIALMSILMAAYFVGQQNDLISNLDPYAVRETVKQWGALGIVVFIGFYVIGLVLYIPGTLFSVAGALLFGKLYGFLAVWIAANIAVNASFLVVRFIGGQLLDEVKHPLVLKMTDRLYEKPIQTIAILRLFLFTAPGLNTVLALSRVRGSDHLWGSLLGAIVPTAMVVMMTDWVLTYFYDLPTL